MIMNRESLEFFDYNEGNGLVMPDDPEKKKKNNDAENDVPKNPLKGTVSADRLREPIYPGTETQDVRINIGGTDSLELPKDYYRIASSWMLGEAGDDDNIDERRRMRDEYSTTEKAFDDVAGNYYRNVLVKKYRANRNDSKDRAKREYLRYVSVPGGDPELAMRQMMRVENPVDDIKYTMQSIDRKELRRLAEPVARYAGYDTDEYLDKFIIPTMHNRLIDELIKDNMPKNKAEYVLRSSIKNSLLGKLSNFGLNLAVGNDIHSTLESEGLNAYDASWGEEFAGGVGGLLIDIPVFGSLGTLSSGLTGKATSVVTGKVANRVLAMKGGETMTREAANAIAKRAIMSKLSNRMLQSAATQGLTLGTYDAANSVADDLLSGEGVDGGKAIGSFFKGAATGTLLGVVGTPLRESASRLTGLRKSAASVGVLGAESAVFTGVTEAEKLANDIEITPVDLFTDYGESLATLGIMRMTHWRPKGKNLKLDKRGELHSSLKLSSSEKAELQELNVNPERFMHLIQNELKLPSFYGSRNAWELMENYTRIMADENVSASAKSKLMFLVENKVSSTPPVPFDYTVDQRKDGRWYITYFDELGRKISRETFDHAGNVKSRLLVQSGRIRKNRVLSFETELTQGLMSQNFLRHAGLYAKEKGVDVNRLSEAMYKKATGEELLPEEAKMIDEIIERSVYDEAGMVQMLYEMRRGIERKHGLEKGSLATYLEDDFFRLAKKENDALNEYEAALRAEVDNLKGGTDKQRSGMLKSDGLRSEYSSMSNEDVKSREVAEYEEAVRLRNSELGISRTSNPQGERSVHVTKVPENENSPYVWSANNVKNTKEDIEGYGRRAQEMGEKYGVKVNLITNETEIPKPDLNNKDDVNRYEMCLKAEGWVHNGKVYINLPNIKSIEHLEKTVLHEAVAHGGLANVFGENIYRFMEDVYRKASPEVRDGIARMGRQYGFADKYTVVEEYLAYLTEKVALTPQERSLYVRAKDYIRNLLVRTGLYSGSNRQVSEAELTSIMQRHSEYMAKRAKSSDHRKDVFGSFRAAHEKEETYYNFEKHTEAVKEKINDGTLFQSTPKYFWKDKGLLYYEQLPERMQRRVRDWLGKSEEEMNRMIEEQKYSLPGKDADDSFVPEKSSASPGRMQGKDSYVPVVAANSQLKDPHYRILKLYSPLYAIEYRTLSEKPFEEWTKHDHRTWDELSSMANGSGTRVQLSDIVNDENLFKEYPAMRTIAVEIVEEMDVPALYDKNNNRFIVDKRTFVSPQAKSFFLSSLEDVASYFQQYETAVSRNVSELNSRISKKYGEASGFARKIRMAQEFIPDFDSDGRIREAFRQNYGFSPDEFLTRFPEADDYFIYRISNGLNRLNGSPGIPGTGLGFSTYRNFFIGPFEIIMDAAAKAIGEYDAPLRMKSKEDMRGAWEKSELQKAETDALRREIEAWENENGPDARKKDPLWWKQFLEENDEKRAVQRIMREMRERNRRVGGKDADLLN